VGISFDPPAKNAEWAKEKGFSFELWTDESRALAQHYGAATSADQARASRETRLLNADGQLQLEYEVGLNLGTHPSSVLADCKRLFGTSSAQH